MADRPIIFSGPMVRALLEGRKTQTRRVLRDQAVSETLIGGGICDPVSLPAHPYSWLNGHDGSIVRPINSPPKYLPGDLLWVRETWGVHWANDNIAPSEITPNNWSVRYDADDSIRPAASDGSFANPDQFKRKRPSIFMPLWASRLTLKVTDVRVQQVRDISEEDGKAEGVEPVPYSGTDPRFEGLIGYRDYSDHPHNVAPFQYAWRSFQSLWDSLNDQRGFGWDKNPWVVALTFEVHHSNVDQFNREVAA